MLRQRAESAGAMMHTSATKFPTIALRAVVLLPGACVEGALAVAVPWIVAEALLGSVWLGAASAGLVLAAMLGTLAAPAFERMLGNRRMTVITGFAVAITLGAAALSWVWQSPVHAYCFALIGIAVDAACDLGFASRVPLLARLSAQKLEQFSATNWLWGIGGAAAGSVLTGSAIASNHIVELAWALASLSLIVAIALAVILPRESHRHTTAQPPILPALFGRQFWTPAAVKLALVLGVFVFFSGPLDNLLLPAHLASRGLPASTFGDMMAALGLGLVAGLWWMQSAGSPTATGTTPAATSTQVVRTKVLVGLFGLIGQLGLMLWLPTQWALLAGLFVCAACFAPLLPMLEAAMLTAGRPAQRTLMLAALSTMIGIADMLGTISMGALMSWSSSSMALGICLGAACLAILVYSAWPKRSYA